MKSLTRQSHSRRIARVIEAILDDPGEAHTVETLAAVANMSPFHFHRTYRAMTGESLAETVRRVRLARAARALVDPDRGVTGIALESGYESPQAFARAFREFAGVSPKAFQDHQRELAQRDRRSAPDIEVVRQPAFNGLALRHDGPAETIRQTWRRLHHMASHTIGEAGLAPRFGTSVGDPEGGDDFIYHAVIAAPPDGGAIEGLVPFTVPGGLFARYRLVGSYDLITQTFRALFGGWLAECGFEPDDRPTIEVYRTAWLATARKDQATDLLIPIKEP